MPNPCIYGADPVVGAPPWFIFDEADLQAVMPWLAGTLTLIGMGVPTSPQNTVEFVNAGPPTDLATDADIAILWNPLLAVASGAYRRLGNTVKANKWAALAVCRAAPDPPAPAVGGGPWRYWGTMTVHGQEQPERVQDFLPRGPKGKLWRAKLLDDSIPQYVSPDARRSFALTHPTYGAEPQINQLVSELYHFTTQNAIAYEDPATYPWQAEFGGVTSDGPLPAQDWDQRARPNEPGPIFYAYGLDYPDTPHGWNGQIVIEFYAPTLPEAEAPEVPSEPEGYPLGAGICESPSLGDLCRSLAAINAKIDGLVERHNPPELVAPDPAVPVEPVEDPPPTGPVPTKPVSRPVRAIGAVVTCTVIPAWSAGFGTDPMYYPNLGHVAEMTEWGPRPSVPLKHVPLVLLDLAAQTETLQLDLAPGVEAEVKWLYGA